MWAAVSTDFPSANFTVSRQVDCFNVQRIDRKFFCNVRETLYLSLHVREQNCMENMKGVRGKHATNDGRGTCIHFLTNNQSRRSYGFLRMQAWLTCIVFVYMLVSIVFLLPYFQFVFLTVDIAFGHVNLTSTMWVILLGRSPSP